VKVVLLERNVQEGPRLAEFFGEAKVDNVDHVGSLAGAHDKVGWLNVAVDEAVVVDEFDAGNLSSSF
jgi:hypothetical protein